MREPVSVTYRAVHEYTPWRKVRGHTSLANALYGRKDGAPGLFDHKVRIDYKAHGEPLYAVIWEDGASYGFVVKRDSSTSDGTTHVQVPIDVILGYDRKNGATPTELEAHFSPAVRPMAQAATEPRVPNQESDLPPLLQAEEGAVSLEQHFISERNSALIDSKKTEVLRATGRLACVACGFDFALKYGEVGKGFCEVHHERPLGSRKHSEITTLNDLVILCSNCHRIVHRTNPMWTVDGLAAYLVAAQAIP